MDNQDRNATIFGAKMSIKKKEINLIGLYVRVSTLNQVDKDSLKTQEERLIAYCKANEISKFEVYRDAGFSARDTNRPALEALMKNIKNGKIRGVFVVKLDRITRSIKDLIHLTEFFNKLFHPACNPRIIQFNLIFKIQYKSQEVIIICECP